MGQQSLKGLGSQVRQIAKSRRGTHGCLRIPITSLWLIRLPIMRFFSPRSMELPFFLVRQLPWRQQPSQIETDHRTPGLRVRQLTKKVNRAARPENSCKSIVYKLLCTPQDESRAAVDRQAIWSGSCIRRTAANLFEVILCLAYTEFLSYSQQSPWRRQVLRLRR